MDELMLNLQKFYHQDHKLKVLKANRLAICVHSVTIEQNSFLYASGISIHQVLYVKHVL